VLEKLNLATAEAALSIIIIGPANKDYFPPQQRKHVTNLEIETGNTEVKR
jgi:hypothetical protein